MYIYTCIYCYGFGNLPLGESIHGHMGDPRISYFISFCLDSHWPLVEGLIGWHASVRPKSHLLDGKDTAAVRPLN